MNGTLIAGGLAAFFGFGFMIAICIAVQYKEERDHAEESLKIARNGYLDLQAEAGASIMEHKKLLDATNEQYRKELQDKDSLLVKVDEENQRLVKKLSEAEIKNVQLLEENDLLLKERELLKAKIAHKKRPATKKK